MPHRSIASNIPSQVNIIDTNVQVWSTSTGLGAELLSRLWITVIRVESSFGKTRSGRPRLGKLKSAAPTNIMSHNASHLQFSAHLIFCSCS